MLHARESRDGAANLMRRATCTRDTSRSSRLRGRLLFQHVFLQCLLNVKFQRAGAFRAPCHAWAEHLLCSGRKEADIVVASIYVNPTQVQELFHYNFQQICCARKRSPLGNAAPPSIGQWNDGLRLQQLGVRLGAHIVSKTHMT